MDTGIVPVSVSCFSNVVDVIAEPLIVAIKEYIADDIVGLVVLVTPTTYTLFTSIGCIKPVPIVWVVGAGNWVVFRNVATTPEKVTISPTIVNVSIWTRVENVEVTPADDESSAKLCLTQLVVPFFATAPNVIILDELILTIWSETLELSVFEKQIITLPALTKALLIGLVKYVELLTAWEGNASGTDVIALAQQIP